MQNLGIQPLGFQSVPIKLSLLEVGVDFLHLPLPKENKEWNKINATDGKKKKEKKKDSLRYSHV